MIDSLTRYEISAAMELLPLLGSVPAARLAFRALFAIRFSRSVSIALTYAAIVVGILAFLLICQLGSDYDEKQWIHAHPKGEFMSFKESYWAGMLLISIILLPSSLAATALVDTFCVAYRENKRRRLGFGESVMTARTAPAMHRKKDRGPGAGK